MDAQQEQQQQQQHQAQQQQFQQQQLQQQQHQAQVQQHVESLNRLTTNMVQAGLATPNLLSQAFTNRVTQQQMAIEVTRVANTDFWQLFWLPAVLMAIDDPVRRLAILEAMVMAFRAAVGVGGEGSIGNGNNIGGGAGQSNNNCTACSICGRTNHRAENCRVLQGRIQRQGQRRNTNSNNNNVLESAMLLSLLRRN